MMVFVGNYEQIPVAASGGFTAVQELPQSEDESTLSDLQLAARWEQIIALFDCDPEEPAASQAVSLETLYQAYNPWVQRLAAAIVGRETGQDAAQTVWFRLHRISQGEPSGLASIAVPREY